MLAYMYILSLLHEKQVHGGIGQKDECAREYGQARNVGPQLKDVKAKGAEYGGAGHFDVETESRESIRGAKCHVDGSLLVVDQGEIFNFINNQSFEAVVED